MHESLIAQAVSEISFLINYTHDSHVEMSARSPNDPNVEFYLSVTALPGETIHGGDTLAIIAARASSAYLTVKRASADASGPGGWEIVLDMEMMPGGVLIDPAAANVQPLRPL